MTVLLMEGFELNSQTALQSIGWTFSASGTWVTTAGLVHKDLAGNGGTYACQFSNGGMVHYTPTFSTTARWASLAAYGAPQAGIVGFYRAGTVQMTLAYNATSSKLELRRGTSSGTLVETSTVTYNPYVLNWIEIELVAKEAASGGLCNVYLNRAATPVIAFVGDCQNAASEDFEQLRFSGGNAISGVSNATIDDVFVSTTRLSGEMTIKIMVPTSNDVVTGTPSAGTNWQCVDEIPPTSGDYVEWVTANQDTYNQGGLGFTPLAVEAVKVSTFAARDGTITGIEGVLKTGGVSYYGTLRTGAAIGTYVTSEDVWSTNPNTATTWQAAEISGIKIGVRVS
jgi:hypothetical protein